MHEPLRQAAAHPELDGPAQRPSSVAIEGTEEALLAAIVESSDDAIISKDLNGIIRSWNRGAKRIFGYQPEEVIGQPVSILAAPERMDEMPNILERIRRGERIDHFDTVRRTKDGAHIHVSLTVSPIRNRAGEIVGASKVARDITERKRSEAAIRASERRFRSIFEEAAEGIWITDDRGFTTDVNPRMAEMLGYSVREMLGRRYSDFVHPEEVDRAKSGFALRMAGDHAVKEYRMWHRAGRTVWVSVSASLLRDDSGAPIGVVALFTDITAHRQAERETREAQNQLVRVLESITDGFIAFDSEWRFTYVNATAERYHNFSRELILGRNVWEAFPDMIGTQLEREYRRSVSEQVVTEFENYYAPWQKWFRVHCYPAQDGGLAVYFLDITETKRAEEERERLTRAVRASEERLSSLVLATTSVLWTANAEGAFVTPQPSWEKYTGQRWPEYSNYGGMRALHPGDLELAEKTWKDSMRRQQPHYLEVRLWNAEHGQFRHTICRAVPVRGPDGSIAEWVGTFEDIHERRVALEDLAKSNEALRESEDHYRHTVELNPQIPWTAREDGQFEDVSPQWLTVTGISRDEALKGGWAKIQHRDDWPRMESAWEHSLKTGEPFDLEHRIQIADGSYRWMRTRARPRYNANGKVTRWYGTTEDIDQRKRAEDQLRHSEERFRMLAVATPSLIFVTDPAGYNTYTNRAFQQYTGRRPEQLLGNEWVEIIHPEDLNRAQTAWSESLRTSGKYDIEYRFRRSDGAYRWHVVRAVPVRDSEGRVTQWVGVCLDIEDQKRAEAALRESEERYRFLAEAIPQFVWTMDGSRRVTYVNQHWFTYTGMSADEGFQKGWDWMIHPDDRQRVASEIESAASVGVPLDTECRLLRADGEYRWHLARARRLWLDDGTERWLGTAVDISERRQMEERSRQLNAELSAKVAELETLLNVIPVGIAFSYDVEGRTPKLNPAAQRLLGVIGSPLNPSKSGPDADALPFRVLRDGAEVPGQDLPLQVAARTGLEVRDEEYEIAHDDGRVTGVLCYASPLLDENGRPRGSVVVLLDITERKIVEAALRKANADLEQFAYAAAHDLQEPARNVALYTQLLARSLQGKLDPIAEQYIVGAIQGGHRMQNLIQDLLSYTRATDYEGGDANADANQVMEEVIGNLGTAINDSKAQVTHGSMPVVAVRATHLTQVLQNLIGNALKYRGPADPRVEVSALPEGRMWVFTVRDNGQGISAEHHERIFKVFKRLHGRDIPGTGIGLAICHRIVTHYGGQIWVKSVPGEGSAFSFTVPGIS